MTEMLSLEGLEFALTRSRRRRTIGIAIERDSELSITAPEETPVPDIETVVRKKLFWIFAKLAEKALLLQPALAKEYVSGEGFHYLGRSYRLLFTAEADVNGEARVRLVGGRFVLPRKAQPRAAELFNAWYAEHALLWLRRRVDLLAAQVGQRPKDIRVRDLANRWGSCSDEGVVNFHWRVIRLPPSLIEYVAAHELIHLLEPRHDAAFWTRLERVLPDYRQRKRALATTGSQY
jgi:predicted metal-dependent hydrolase